MPSNVSITQQGKHQQTSLLHPPHQGPHRPHRGTAVGWPLQASGTSSRPNNSPADPLVVPYDTASGWLVPGIEGQLGGQKKGTLGQTPSDGMALPSQAAPFFFIAAALVVAPAVLLRELSPSKRKRRTNGLAARQTHQTDMLLASFLASWQWSWPNMSHACCVSERERERE